MTTSSKVKEIDANPFTDDNGKKREKRKRLRKEKSHVKRKEKKNQYEENGFGSDEVMIIISVMF